MHDAPKNIEPVRMIDDGSTSSGWYQDNKDGERVVKKGKEFFTHPS